MLFCEDGKIIDDFMKKHAEMERFPSHLFTGTKEKASNARLNRIMKNKKSLTGFFEWWRIGDSNP